MKRSRGFNQTQDSHASHPEESPNLVLRYDAGMTSMGRSTWVGRRLAAPARRVVSLVPSLTDAVFRLGAGDRLVARTRYCVRPVGRVEAIRTIGGTKNPDVASILGLRPDMVLANREENTRTRVETLAKHVPVLLTDPQTPQDVPDLWMDLGRGLGLEANAGARATECTDVIDRLRASRPTQQPSFIYWIWRNPWMAAGHATYISRLLELAGWRNALPRECERYPKATPGEALACRPTALLFSSEPFEFELPQDLADFAVEVSEIGGAWRLAGGPAALPVDGEVLSWYPSLTVEGLRYAERLRETLAGLNGPAR
jgi:iron complex transport system substrate-binding protein